MSYIVVLGNEKGGTGKSTVAMHLIAYLLREGYSVGSIDVDARQGTLSRYVENRTLRATSKGEDLPIPEHHALFKSKRENLADSMKEENDLMAETLQKMSNKDCIIIDTPGNDTYLSRLAHAEAHTLITPLNDSFIDLDMLVRVQPDSMNILRPSTYSEMVWDQKKERAMNQKQSIDWIVMRNRLSSIYSRNKEEMEKVLNALAKRIGFRLVMGFGERVIFRELFLNGITLLDLKETGASVSMSHIAAKQELVTLIQAIQWPFLSRTAKAS